MKGLISYRIGAKQQYIARAKRVYRVCLQTYRQAEKREDILAIKPIVLSFYLYKGVGLAHRVLPCPKGSAVWQKGETREEGGHILSRDYAPSLFI